MWNHPKWSFWQFKSQVFQIFLTFSIYVRPKFYKSSYFPTFFPSSVGCFPASPLRRFRASAGPTASMAPVASSPRSASQPCAPTAAPGVPAAKRRRLVRSSWGLLGIYLWCLQIVAWDLSKDVGDVMSLTFTSDLSRCFGFVHGIYPHMFGLFMGFTNVFGASFMGFTNRAKGRVKLNQTFYGGTYGIILWTWDVFWGVVADNDGFTIHLWLFQQGKWWQTMANQYGWIEGDGWSSVHQGLQ